MKAVALIVCAATFWSYSGSLGLFTSDDYPLSLTAR